MAHLDTIRPRAAPDYVHLADEDRTTHRHGDGNYGKVYASKFQPAHMDVFPGQYVPPQETRQRSAECRTEGSIVDAQCHAVHSSPEGPV